MKNERAILHSDLNGFYASVEIMLNPALRDKAVAVCGSTEDRHGIVYEIGESQEVQIETGMVRWEARKRCPGLLVVPSIRPVFEIFQACPRSTSAYRPGGALWNG